MKKSSWVFTVKTSLFLVLFSILNVSPAIAGWEVTWIDKFDGSGVNWDNWTAQIQANYNNEVQCYTDDESSANRNFEVSDGTLKIISRRQNINCPGLGGQARSWTSGRLNSKDKAEFLFGRIEARIRFLELRGGTWPAFWMLENRIAEDPFKGDNDNVNWPNPGAGEIDVWEWYGNNGDRYITNFFNTQGCGSEVRVSYPGGAPDVMSFRTYAMEWTADEIVFLMDDQVVAQQDVSNCSQYEEPMFFLLNVAMGGTLGGTIDPQLNSATMEVDYVAHCIKSSDNDFQRCNESTPAIVDDDGDGVSNSIDECPNTPAGAVVNAVGCQIFTEPQSSAPEPLFPEVDVVSLFSDSYTNISDINYNPDWGQATQVSIVDIAGNSTLKYEGLNYQGTDFERNKQDVSDKDNVHFDYWTYNATRLKFFLISPGPQETAFEVDVKQGQWESVVVPLTAFAGVNLTDLFQLKVEGNGTVYFDNIFFSAEGTQGSDEDGDGVDDSVDQCPNTASGVAVDNVGCALENNQAPVVSLSANQGGTSVSSVAADGGMVTIQASVVDENTNDTHSFVWTLTGVTSFENNGASISFNPSGITVAQITVSVEVSDSAQTSLSDSAQLTMSVTQPTPTPPAPVQPPSQSSGGGSMNLFMLFTLGLVLLRRRMVSETKFITKDELHLSK
jgi:beta-glucanase (GH16 family)